MTGQSTTITRVAKRGAIGNNPSVPGPFALVALDFAENGLSIVVFGAILFSLVVGLALLGGRRQSSLYDRIGQGGLTPESDYSRGTRPEPPDSAAARAEREEEVRQMLRARSDRLERAGRPPLDIDAEVARLLGGAGPAAPESHSRERDHGLVEEVRQLVLARNDRRARQGLEPLDVEAEVTRTLTELDP